MPLSRTEKISHYAVVVIAICAVVVSVWQGRISERQLEIEREHNRLTVRPYLDAYYLWEGSSKWTLNLTNEGIGPAIVKSISYFYEGKEYQKWEDVLEAANIKQLRVFSFSFSEDAPFSAEKTQPLLELTRGEGERGSIGIELLVKYTSIYNEPFEFRMDF